MRKDTLLAAAFVVLWSSGFVGAELGTAHAAPDTLLAWRYAIAAALLWLAVAARRAAVPRGATRRQVLLGLLTQVLYLGGVVTGVALGVPAGTVALVAALQPLVVAAAAGPVLGERTTARQRAGLAAGLVGVALVVVGDLGPGTAPWWAFLLPVGAMLSLSAGTLAERRLRPPESPLVSMALQATTAAVVFVAAAGLGGRLTPPDEPVFWVAVAWTVVLSSFGGYGTYLLVLRRRGPVRVSALLYLTPPTTMAWTLAMFGEVPGPLAGPGLALCAVGVRLALRSPGGGPGGDPGTGAPTGSSPSRRRSRPWSAGGSGTAAPAPARPRSPSAPGPRFPRRPVATPPR
jgi:drug/metabolite transporter (DMT)-like permease